MRLVDYLKEHEISEKIDPSDKRLEGIWQDLTRRWGEENPPHHGFFGYGENRAPVRKTLELYSALSEEQKNELISDKHANGIAKGKPRDFWKAGFVLRGFPNRWDIYHELSARWNVQFKIIEDKGTSRWVAHSPLDHGQTDDLNEAEAQFRIFSRKYDNLPENRRMPLLKDLGEVLYLAWDPLEFIGVDSTGDDPYKAVWIKDLLKYANPRIPDRTGTITGAEGLRTLGYGEDQIFIYENRDKLLKLHEGIAKPNLKAWNEGVSVAYNHQLAHNFLELSQVELNLLYQAHGFYDKALGPSKTGQNEEERSKRWSLQGAYEKGLVGSLRNGTVAPWASAIIEHFRSGSVGGSNYRVSEGAA